MDYTMFCRFRHDLSNVLHISDLKNICKSFCSQVGLEYFFFGVCEAVSFSSPRVITITNYPSDWLEKYYCERIASRDPLFRYSLTSSAPLLWSEIRCVKEYSKATDKDFFCDLENLGFSDGLTIPIMSSNNQSGMLNLTTTKKVFSEEMFGGVMLSANIFSKYLFDAYIRIDKIENPKANVLTERELECIFWACEGKTAWEMSQIVGVSERTINFHLTSVIKKLGASNRQHAVAKAVMYGIVRAKP